MKNKMQKLYLAPQISADTQEPVFFNVYENETVVDKATGEEITRGTARVVFAHKTRKLNVFTKNSTSKTVRAVVGIPLDNVEDTRDVVEFLQSICDTSALPKNFFTNQDVMSNFIETNEKLSLAIPARIVTQEFAFKVLRYKAGNTADCLKSYVDALSTNKTYTYTDSVGVERTVDTPAFGTKLNNVLKRAVRKSNPKLLVTCTDPKTGLFSTKLLGALDLKELSPIMKNADEILFGTVKNQDGILKRPRKGAPALQTKDGKYILSDNFFIDDEDMFDQAPDIKVEHDSENASFIKYQNDTRAERIRASIIEDESEDEEDDDEETVGADASFETGEE
jgi:glutaredoxin-related protein